MQRPLWQGGGQGKRPEDKREMDVALKTEDGKDTNTQLMFSGQRGQQRQSQLEILETYTLQPLVTRRGPAK